MNLACVMRARSGDPAATEEMIHTLRPRLTRMAAYYARRCREDADDLLQEAWAGLLEALPALDPGIGDPEQYLVQYARWRLLDAIKRAHARRWVLLLDQQIEPEAIPPDIAATLDAIDLAAFLPRLTPTQRAVLTCLLAGLTWRETGAALGCTCANVAYHVRQIRGLYGRWKEEEEVKRL